MTRSKASPGSSPLPSRSVTSPWRASTRSTTPLRAALRRAQAAAAGDLSTVTTCAPRSAAVMPNAPLPENTSRTRSPSRTSMWASRNGEVLVKVGQNTSRSISRTAGPNSQV